MCMYECENLCMAIKNEERFWNRLHVLVAVLTVHCSLRRLRRIAEHRRNRMGGNNWSTKLE